ncbi:MAG: AAA family ATPase [Nitrospinae bacterium]|nr:AAA family ATPase [Nitrospinota bacterium]
MRILEIHIDGFGALGGRSFKNLQPGINLLYGPNEAGKTTLLEFIRRILFGFPSKKAGKINYYAPMNGGARGGRLICQLANGETAVIRRVDGPSGGKVWATVGGEEQEGQPAVDALLGHASEEIYKNIYAFSIAELQDFGTLNGEQIKSRIYGAGLGLGGVSLAGLEKGLQEFCDDIFKSPRKGSKHKMGDLLNEIREEEIKIRQVQEALGQFDELSTRLEQLDRDRESLESRIREAEERRSALKTQEDLYPVYLELADAESHLARLEEITGFPENGFEVFSRRRREIEQAKRRLDEEAETLEKWKSGRDNIQLNAALLEREADIAVLREQTGKVSSAIQDSIGVRQDRELLDGQIETEIQRIGKNWSEDAVLKFELTEAERSHIQKFRKDLEAACDSVRSARSKLELRQEQMAGEASARPDIPMRLQTASMGLSAVGLIGAVWSAFLLNAPLALLFAAVLVFGVVLYRWSSRRKEEPPGKDPLEAVLEERLEKAKKEEDRLFEEWRGWLAERNLDPLLTPLEADRIIDLIHQVKTTISQRAGLDKRLDRMRETEESAKDAIGKIMPALPGISRPNDPCAAIGLIGHCFDEARTNREKQFNLDAQINELERKIQKLAAGLEKERNALSGLVRSAGARDEDDFARRHNLLEQRRSLEKILDEKRNFIQNRVGVGEGYDRFLEVLRSSSPERRGHELRQISAELEGFHKNKDDMNQVIGETRNKIASLSSNEELLVRQSELEIKKRQLEVCAGEWAARKTALALLSLGKRKYERERQPAVIKAAEDIFSRITENKYRGIYKPIDSDEIRISANGAEKSLGVVEMSRGTREQLYLAMRFGLVQEYEARSEPLPVVMDDIFVNFDDERLARAIGTLENFARTRQVIVFSCHRRQMETYRELGAHEVFF